MSNQFYRYLSNRLEEFFKNNKIKPGERFYFDIDDKNQVEDFYRCLKDQNNTEEFSYKHMNGGEYKTFLLKYENIDVVVASATNVTNAYLVTIRNASNVQTGNWKDKALLILCEEGNDSIKSGCCNLKNEGMPFNIKSIASNLNNDISESNLCNADKYVAEYCVNKKYRDEYISSIWDYADILSIINKGKIEDDDYEKFGLFRDNSLDTYTKSARDKRLKENQHLHDLVEKYQDYDDKKDQLEKFFGEDGAKELSKDNWCSYDFNKVYKYHDDNNKQKPLEYIESNKKITAEGLVFWEREESSTASGKRKKHIIVFNDGKDEVNLSFLFSDRLSKNFINIKDRVHMQARGRSLYMKLPCNKTGDPQFYKLVYKHKDQTKSKYDFNIVIVNIEENILESIKTKYVVSTRNKCLSIGDTDKISFGNSTNKRYENINESGKVINITSDDNVELSIGLSNNEDNSIKFVLQSLKGNIQIEVKESASKSRPIRSTEIIGKKYQMKQDFIYDNGVIKQGTGEFYIKDTMKELIAIEKNIIDNQIFYGKKDINGINKIYVKYSEELENAYLDILDYYKRNDSTPTLSYINTELEDLYKKYIEIYNKEIEAIEENDKVSNIDTKKYLHKIGLIEDGYIIYLSPFSPLNIAYRLEYKNQIDGQDINTSIIERLVPNNLLPYIYNDEKELFAPVIQQENLEWIKYENKRKVSIGEVNAFVAAVIQEKLEQFIKNFSYLFIKGSNAPIKINVINIANDKEVVKGIVKFIKKQIEHGSEKIIPIEVNVYNKLKETSFREFLSESSLERLELDYDIDFNTNKKQLDKVDVWRLIIDNIQCNIDSGEEYKYCHISFYNPGYEDKEAEEMISSLESGLSLGGMLSTLTSNHDQDDYRIGFGMKNILSQKNDLIRTSINMNQFTLNCSSNLFNPYKKDLSIVTMPLMMNSKVRDKLYDSSHWVTFIEPSFGLEYFKEEKNNNLIVIHYSDQYSTSKYDTITVTNKCDQYITIIKEFLEEKGIHDIQEDRIKNVIKNFNAINGQWLLNLVAHKNHDEREKISILSAIKYVLSILDHQDIIWIPISLEEILRVSKAVKLYGTSEIFSIRELKESGVYSDDLIFIGVNIKDINNLKMYYYPVEVKIGYKDGDFKVKGKEQINKTYKLFKKQLAKFNEENEVIFKNKFFRNFFSRLLISNAEKMIINNLWKEKEIDRINELKKYLLDDQYEISYNLESAIGKGALISFKKDNSYRRMIIENDGILSIELTEDDSYKSVSKYIQEVCDEINSENSEIRKEDLLANKNLESLTEIYSTYDEEDEYEDEEDNDFTEETTPKDTSHEEYTDEKVEITEIESNNLGETSKPIMPLDIEKYKNIAEGNAVYKTNKDCRVLIGEVEGSTKKIYWEYDNKSLDNRHMLITGKSGNGKTYFIQCALLECMKYNIPSVIIDYTDGFKMSQLEKKFKDFMGDGIKQFVVCQDKFPLNPFKHGKKELDEGMYVDEDDIDVAQRFASVIGAVYSDLGSQQINAIYEAVLNGLKKHGDKLTLKLFREELIEIGTSYAKTATSKLAILIDKSPFQEDGNFDWSQLDVGKILLIIQLTGFSADVKKIITEIILWDLWNYKAQFGKKENPFNIVLDEVQNLNFKDNSPCKKILTEGRKFGWSAWFATQFLEGQFDKSIINSLQNSGQKIYFAQVESEASNVANILAKDNNKKEWTQRLLGLEKGSCISYGPILDKNGKLTTISEKVKIISLDDRVKNID